jgi:hypothetical protein
LVGICKKRLLILISISVITASTSSLLCNSPFIRASFDADQQKLEEIIVNSINKVITGQSTADIVANAIGAQAAQFVQNFIDTNQVKPQSDFSKKTQHTTLYETGTHIRDRISYELEG